MIHFTFKHRSYHNEYDSRSKHSGPRNRNGCSVSGRQRVSMMIVSNGLSIILCSTTSVAGIVCAAAAECLSLQQSEESDREDVAKLIRATQDLRPDFAFDTVVRVVMSRPGG